MSIDRSVLSKEIKGFPDKVVIRERLISACDLNVLKFWAQDFGLKPRAIIKAIQKNEKCTQSQAKALVDECFQISLKRARKKKAR
jgi:hypothetical protein